ncbi:MAG: glycosyltransferase family 9 protein [Flavobacteriales bacterium]|nr:glycosyltransferase family 9 protein [Flavobacteriales bacterium]
MKVKVLIVRFSSIGDIVLTTPEIRCLKKQLEGEVEIHYLTKKVFQSTLVANPYLSKIHTIDGKVSEVIDALKAENYDYVVDLHNNIRSRQVKKGLNSLAFTVDKLSWEKWLLTTFKINKLPKIHIVDRYLETCKALTIKNDNLGLDYFIPTEDEVDLVTLPPTIRKGYIGFVIGGTYATKKLPTEKIISICRKIKRPIVLLGGKEDEAVAREITAELGSIVFNACGKYNLNQSASLVRQADKIISHDTGLMHVAAAFKKQIISVWGNTIPELGMYPYLPGENSKIVEVTNLRCRPCSKLGYTKCPKKHFNCMNMIDELEIANLD